MVKKKTLDWSNTEAVGAQVLAYEIALTSLLKVLAETQPAIALRVVQELQANVAALGPEWAFVKDKASQYVKLIQANAKLPH